MIIPNCKDRRREQHCEEVYRKFNIDHPADFKGHSLSVSDIVVLRENGKNSAHFVDSFGFTGIPDFMRKLEGEKKQEWRGAGNGACFPDSRPLHQHTGNLIEYSMKAEIVDIAVTGSHCRGLEMAARTLM